jgi:hypothetical protein
MDVLVSIVDKDICVGFAKIPGYLELYLRNSSTTTTSNY